ncbi:MAG: 4Fe-4S binding protein [Opitutales bacterium]|nr:4Fe-4S binding protein [Opitutales bacterium]
MSHLSRRDLFKRIFAPVRSTESHDEEKVADSGHYRILEEQCLAYLNTFCSNCKERCPEPGAIVVELGKPVINSEICTNCGICYEVCPAPINAIAIDH